MSVQERSVIGVSVYDAHVIDYRDTGRIEQRLASGWVYLGRQQWLPASVESDGHPPASSRRFLPPLEADVIGSDDLVLTHPKLGDAPDLCANEADADLRRHAIFPPTPHSIIESMILDAYLGWRLGDSTFLVARHSLDGPPLAKISIRRLVPPGVLDVGYATMPEHRGRGYAARALRLFTEWAFREAGIQRIELGIKPGNRASVSTAVKAGYQLESVRRSRLRNADGSFDDEHSYVALNTDTDRTWSGAA